MREINIVCAKCEETICQTGLSFAEENRLSIRHADRSGCWGDEA